MGPHGKWRQGLKPAVRILIQVVTSFAQAHVFAVTKHRSDLVAARAQEFVKLIQQPEAARILQDVGVDAAPLIDRVGGGGEVGGGGGGGVGGEVGWAGGGWGVVGGRWGGRLWGAVGLWGMLVGCRKLSGRVKVENPGSGKLWLA